MIVDPAVEEARG